MPTFPTNRSAGPSKRPTSSDPNYASLPTVSVSATNQDNEPKLLRVSSVTPTNSGFTHAFALEAVAAGFAIAAALAVPTTVRRYRGDKAALRVEAI